MAPKDGALLANRINYLVDMTEGVSAALAQVLDGQAEPDALVQAGLFADLEPAETGNVDAPSPLSPRLESPLADALRRPGRPKGAKNRRTAATVSWLLAQHRHPLAVMAEAYSMTPVQLAERLGLAKRRVTLVRAAGGQGEAYEEKDEFDNATLLELFKLQVRMAEALAPYVAQKLPQAVTVEGAVDFTLHVGGVSFPARGAAAGGQGEAIEGQFGVVLPAKSDDPSRTDG